MAMGSKAEKWWSAPPAGLRCAFTLGSVVSAVILAMVVDHYWQSTPYVSLFLCAILCSAWFGGLRQALLAIALSVLAFAYYFLPPTHTLAVNLNELPRLILFAVAALLVGALAAAQRSTTVSLRRTRDELFEKVQELQRTNEALHLENAQRKQAENALRSSETYLAEAQRLSHTGSFGWKVASGEIQWSEETFRIFEYDRTLKPSVELILQRVHPEDVALVKNLVASASHDGKDFDIEHRIVMPDGSIKHLHIVARAERDKSNEPSFVGAVMDVTQRRLVEAALRRNETYLAEAQRLSKTGSWVWNVKTKENVFWSREHYRIFGFDPDTESGQYGVARERIHPADLRAFDEKLDRAIQEQSDFEIDYRIVLPGGEVKHVHNLGHPVLNNSRELVEYIGTTMDVTDQVKAKVALEEAFSKIKKSEARLQTIIDTIPTLAWSGEADGSVEFVNLRWRNYTGLTSEQARGLRWQAAIHPEDVGWIADQWRITTAAGKPSELEARLRRYDGQYRWFIHRAEPLLDQQGRIVKWYGTNTDIDDRKRAEEALRRAQEELTHITRITTMGELTASIAHEVNQPLTAVVNNANACLSLLPNGTPHLEEVREALTEILDDTDRASAVIARVRQLARKAPFERSPLDLNEVITDVLALARYESASRRVTIRTELAGELPLVLGDRVQLQQVLLNLIVNGMDAMSVVEESKRVLIICGRCETSDGVPRALLSVQDAGIGFKPVEADRLFEAFYTTKPQGMGMGLAISRSIIEAHGGCLWAEPNQGPGATFLFNLPAAPERLGEGGPAAGNAAS
jgi:PAS domain S-box-containing protein